MRKAVLVDTAGVAAATLIVFSGYVSAAHSGGDPDALALLTIGVVAAVVLARIISSANRTLIPLLVIAAAAWLVMSSLGDLFSSWPLGGPFGYVNAKGALFGQVALAGLALVVLGKRPPVRTLGWIVALVAAAVTIMSGTIAVVSLLPAAVLGLTIRKVQAVRVLVWGCAFAVLSVLVATVLLAALHLGHDAGSAERLAVKSLSGHRVALWHDAWAILRENPRSGVGPARFQFVSPTARADHTDSRWAHNEFLQIGAETGVPGLIGLMGVFAWGFARLSVAATPTRATGLGALALAFLGIQACVDYVFHFPAIPVLGAVLVGGLIERASDPLPDPVAVVRQDATPVSEAARGARSW